MMCAQLQLRWMQEPMPDLEALDLELEVFTFFFFFSFLVFLFFFCSALHIAAKHGYAAVCSLLLERGVDGNVKTKVFKKKWKIFLKCGLKEWMDSFAFCLQRWIVGSREGSAERR
jgi:hypothetical protein